MAFPLPADFKPNPASGFRLDEAARERMMTDYDKS